MSTPNETKPPEGDVQLVAAFGETIVVNTRKLSEKLNAMLDERDSLRERLAVAEKRDWTGSLCDRLNSLVRENASQFSECKDGPTACDLVSSIHGAYNALRAENERLKEVAGWAQTTLTALNSGDVRKESPLHLKLREVMIKFRALGNAQEVRD